MEYLTEVPEGWRKIKGASTAPNGFDWYCNGESRFNRDGKYKSALVKRKSEA